MIENKETITYDEFRAWMTGLIVGKRGALPDLEDWKMIKKMMDKVVPEKEVITIPSIPAEPIQPYNPAPYQPWYPGPYVGDPVPNPNVIWCGGPNSAYSSGDTSDKFDMSKLSNGGDYGHGSTVSIGDVKVDSESGINIRMEYNAEDFDNAFNMMVKSNTE